MKTKQLVTGLLISLAVTACADNSSAPVPTAVAQDPTTAAVAPFAIYGTVAVRERIALPPEAILTVTLSDAAGTSKTTKVLAQQVQRLDGRQAPFQYLLPLQTVTLTGKSKAFLSAAITVNNKVVFATDRLQPIVSTNGQKKDIHLIAVPQVAIPVTGQ